MKFTTAFVMNRKSYVLTVQILARLQHAVNVVKWDAAAPVKLHTLWKVKEHEENFSLLQKPAIYNHCICILCILFIIAVKSVHWGEKGAFTLNMFLFPFSGYILARPYWTHSNYKQMKNKMSKRMGSVTVGWSWPILRNFLIYIYFSTWKCWFVKEKTPWNMLIAI